MRKLSRVGLAAALLVPVVAAPATAQSWRFDFGVNGGYSWYSNAMSSDETGLTGDNDDVKFEAGPLLGSQLTFWLSPRIGLRANATYADRDLVNSNDSDTQGSLVPHVNLWSGSGDLLFRFATPNEEFAGTEFLPYLALGVGAKWHNPATDWIDCNDATENKTWSCAPFTAGPSEFALGEQKVLMGLVGLGSDIRLSRGLALRLEVNDRMWKPQIYAAEQAANVVQLPNGDELVSKTVHEIGAQLGLHFLMGMARPEVVAVAPAPLPPPPPPPAQPEPPREDAISVCVIDPTSPSGIRMQSALFLHATNDTVVEMNGNRVPLRQSVGQVQVARTADWYVRGEPLTLKVGEHQLQYLTYQGATQIPAEQLTFIGTINGFPVYANKAEVADLEADLAELRTARNSNNLEDLLDERNDVRGELEDIKLLYVPLEPTGCVFQTVQMLEQVRKGK
jgi:hypothetical protein